MKSCEIRKNGRRAQRYGVDSNASMEELSRDLSATVLLKQYQSCQVEVVEFLESFRDLQKPT